MQEGTLYEYTFDKPSCKWKKWMDTVVVSPIPESTAFHEIIVPTIDTVRYMSLMNLLVTHQVHVLIAGPTGTGKTIYIKEMISNLDKNLFGSIQTAFSAQTNANQVNSHPRALFFQSISADNGIYKFCCILQNAALSYFYGNMVGCV